MITFFFVLCIGVGIFIQFLGLAFLLRFWAKKIPALKTDKPLPGVSIVKTCYKAEDNEEKNFDILFHQDYPGAIEILFVVSDERDPIVPLIKDYIARYPQKDARLVFSKTRKAFWKKVDALYDAHQAVKHEIVIWSDSDVILKPNYVSQMVACLQEPGVSVVTTPQYDTRANNFATAVKTLGNNCDVATSVMYMDFFVENKKIGFGQSIGFRKAEFDSFGPEAWDTVNRFLADDQALPYLYHLNGKKVVFRNIYCPVQFSDKTISDVVRQKYRWLVPQKMAIGNRFVYLIGILIYPILMSTLFLFIDEFSSLSVALFAVSCFSRIFVSFVFEALILGSVEMTLRYFWAILIWDVSQLFFFIVGFFKNTMKFGNREFRVVNRYFLEEVAQVESLSIKHNSPDGIAES